MAAVEEQEDVVDNAIGTTLRNIHSVLISPLCLFVFSLLDFVLSKRAFFF